MIVDALDVRVCWFHVSRNLLLTVQDYCVLEATRAKRSQSRKTVGEGTLVHGKLAFLIPLIRSIACCGCCELSLGVSARRAWCVSFSGLGPQATEDARGTRELSECLHECLIGFYDIIACWTLAC